MEPIDNIDNQVVEGTDTQVVDDELSSLPSDEDLKGKMLENFQITDEIKEKYFKGDKLFGRFDNLEGMVLALKSVEDKYSSVMRDIKGGKYQEVQATEAEAQSNEPTVAYDNPIVQEFFSNGMELTDDILSKAKEAGLDIRDVKLAAIEIKEQVGKAYSIVGGESEYKAMVEWAKSNLDEKSASQFDREIKSGMGEFAIRGLYSEYKASVGSSNQEQPRTREYGDAPSKSTSGYGSREELLRDKAYIESQRGKADAKAVEAYRRKLDRTPDSVIYGR